MRAEQKFKRAALAFSLVAPLLLPTETSAVTVEVARKCNALVAKNFPPRQPGNPAAGSAKGNGQAERDYFKKCVDNGGNVDDTADKDKK
ncbi:hypothetical protein [Bradyrhizobium erythrophlei]|jgi:hypothetical protein|uniref:Uncharacterized protein n=1 Tax=Bradyrhizobium erythrophlei TaxID=1437360 RepID=A0A1H5EIT0_9BRAD|nr:hypothetical protein [Bradyrhizobium erythrophlei]SED91083.1 hypothetical protein SAMN05444164_6256 [Bradyrhizobium erythrophlei]